MRTIIYLTDNSLDERIAELCRCKLADAAGSIPIVSVSQKPVTLGYNVCVGEIGRCWLSLYKQLLAGCEAAIGAEWVAVAEHDCLYTSEHLSYTPASRDVFWYNDNRWLVQWGGNHPELNGMYSWWSGSLALSQLVCDRELLRECIAERVKLLEGGVEPGEFGKGEPGITTDEALRKARKYATNGSAAYLRPFMNDYLTRYEHKTFRTKLPNLDIRHSTNFTGPKRGSKRRYELPYWGEFFGGVVDVQTLSDS
jgi:hypothetical protein